MAHWGEQAQERHEPIRCRVTLSDGSVNHTQVPADILVNVSSPGLVSTATDYVHDETAQGPILADLLRDRVPGAKGPV